MKRRSISLTALIWWAIFLDTITRIIAYPFQKMKEILTQKPETKEPDPVDNINPHSDK